MILADLALTFFVFALGRQIEKLIRKRRKQKEYKKETELTRRLVREKYDLETTIK